MEYIQDIKYEQSQSESESEQQAADDIEFRLTEKIK
jgi:hypothetical protein